MTDYNELWYTSQDGLRLFARDYACSSESAVTAICIPGLTRNSADFHELCMQMREHCRMIAVDLRGRGRSQYDKQPDNYHPGSYVNDVQELVSVLDLSKVVLIGTSLGGLVSILIGATRPAWLKGLIINDFGPELEQAGLDRIKSYVGRAAPVSDWQQAVEQCKACNGSELPNLNDAQWLAFAKKLYREDAQGTPVLAYDPLIARPFDANENPAASELLWSAFEAIPAMPALLIRGAQSDLLSTRCVAEMLRRRPDLMFAEVANRGHAPLLNEPEALEAIDQLLASVSQQPA